MRLSLALTLALAAGCTETIQLTHDPLENLVAIEVTPTDALITITDLATPHHTLQYQAMARFADGSTRDVTELASWSIDNTLLGAFDTRGLFVASHAAVGSGRVAIALRDQRDEAALKVVVDATIVDPTFPPPAADLFDRGKPVVTGDPTRSPELVYPADQTLFPRAIARTLFDLTPGAGNDAFRLGFANELLHLDVETGADRWAAEGALQQLLATAGLAAPLQVEVRATASTGSTIFAGAPITLRFSRDTPGNALFFWSAATNGIMRGEIDATKATKLYPGSGVCVGCHVLSRDSSSLAMGMESGDSYALQAIEIATLATRISATAGTPMGWATYSPDGERMVVANNGELAMYDARTGAALGGVPLPAGRYATHPDWSPDGTALAVALTGQVPTNRAVKAAAIAVLRYDSGAWGAPETLVSGSNSNNNYFPRWSPDGSVLAFVHATTISQGAMNAELMIVPATGGTPTPLDAANRRVGRGELSDLANTMPAWAPQVGERAWLAFVSARPYGGLVTGRGQIWITSIDLTSNNDSTTPAFWLPSQDVTVLNYNPAWSSEVITQ